MQAWCRQHWRLVEGLFFLALTLVWLLPWAVSGRLYLGDDLGFHLNRFYTLVTSPHWWQIPAVATRAFSGWGYPINLFYPAGTLLPAAWLQRLFGPVIGYYLFIGAMTWLTMMLSAWVTRRLLGSRLQGLLVAVLYGFAHYRLLDFFVRGSLAEGLLFTFLPLVIYGTISVAMGDWRQWGWLAGGMTLVAWTHVLSLVLCSVAVLGLLGTWGFVRNHVWRRLGALGLAALTTLGLAAGFLGPLAEQLHAIGTLGVIQYSLAASALQPLLLFSDSLTNQMASDHINIGVIMLLLSLLALACWRRLAPLERYLLVVGWVFLVMSTKLFPWRWFQPVLGPIQFPWRFLALACFPLAIVGAKVILLVFAPQNWPAQARLLTGTTLLVAGMALMANNHLYETTVPTGNKIITAATYRQVATTDQSVDYVGERSQVSMDAVRTHSVTVMNPQANGQLRQLGRQTLPNGFRYRVWAQRSLTIKLPQLAYPGMHLTLDGHDQPLRANETDVIRVTVPAGKHTVVVAYRPTVVQVCSRWVTLLTVIGVLAMAGWRWRAKRATAN